MIPHIEPNDPRYSKAASAILQRHEASEPEANITSAIRDFLILTCLAKADEIVEENPPSPDGKRRAVDLTALDTFIEVNCRIGTTGGFNPNPSYVQQLDDYLPVSATTGHGVRTGILTDGRYWFLRWPGAGSVKLAKPYAFTLENPRRWLPLFEWLRDDALTSIENIPPSLDAIERRLGPKSPLYERDIAALRRIFDQNVAEHTIVVKRDLWFDLLRAALGEIAHTPEQTNDLFVRHTYLTMVIGMVVQASFGLDITTVAENDPADLLRGRTFINATGLNGVLESDFFACPTEVGGQPAIRALARRIARFDWRSAGGDIASLLYQTVIPAEERRTLGEYYTPAWLAQSMVRELVNDPLNQRVLDSACGSGTFLTVVVDRYIRAARAAKRTPKEVLDGLVGAATGIDVHPVAVHLARAAWVLSARRAIRAAVESGYQASISVPVYLGDALQLRFQTGNMFAQHDVTIQVGDEANTELVFPISLVERASDFDSLMDQVADAIESGEDPTYALDDNGISDPGERKVLEQTIARLQSLHLDGRDHIWAYYTRNLVRPVALSRTKVDIIIGNPPWINYNQTADVLRTELRRLSQDTYGIWAGGRYATHQDVAGLFYTRSVDLYLENDGIIGMVMPHSALQSGQYTRWRTGDWKAQRGGAKLAADFTFKPAWDLEGLNPNDFFPVPACVVFAERAGLVGRARPLGGQVERWSGPTGSDEVSRESISITDTSGKMLSPYGALARQGATIVPRCLFFVHETDSAASIQAGGTVTVSPRRGSQDKAPWKDLDLSAISGRAVETQHVFDVHLGETLVPYTTLPPLKAVLPVTPADVGLARDSSGDGGIDLARLGQRMRPRWRTISDTWDTNKTAANRLDLAGQLDFFGK